MTFEAAYVKTETLSPNAEEFSPAPGNSGGVDDDSVRVKQEMIFLPENMGMKVEEESPKDDETDWNGWTPLWVTPEDRAAGWRRRDRFEFEEFGRSVAAKLREMSGSDDTQCVIAEKLIADVIFHGQLQALTPDTLVTVPRGAASGQPRHATH